MLLCVGISANAQDLNPVFYRQYATQQYMKALIAGHPEMIEARATIERQTFDFLRYGVPDTPYIPVVVHLVGSAAAAITMQDVEAQLSQLNHDFSLPEFIVDENTHPAWQAEHFDEKAARPSINFCLASIDPLGGATTGVLYVNSQVTSFPIGTTISTVENGGSLAWNTKKYLNIWVAPIDGNMAGFAQMPGGPIESDGIVINSAFFARRDRQAFVTANPAMANYSFGRTLSHLVGSYLNVYELWNDDQPCADDNVMDTPIHNAPNYDKPGYRHVSTCMDNPVEMTMNLMDNTDDEAQYMFTNGQMMRMYASLETEVGPRSELRFFSTTCSGSLADGGADERGLSSQVAAPNSNLILQIFPNPASNGFIVLVTSPCEEEIRLTAFNQNGRKQFSKTVENASIEATNSIYINSRDWATGMYMVQVQCGKEVASAKLLIAR